MADTDKMLERYKAEVAKLLDRCLDAEEERDFYNRLYDYASGEWYKAKKAIESLTNELNDLTAYKDELRAKLDLAEEFITDRGVNPADVYNVNPEADADLENADG